MCSSDLRALTSKIGAVCGKNARWIQRFGGSNLHRRQRPDRIYFNTYVIINNRSSTAATSPPHHVRVRCRHLHRLAGADSWERIIRFITITIADWIRPTMTAASSSTAAARDPDIRSHLTGLFSSTRTKLAIVACVPGGLAKVHDACAAPSHVRGPGHSQWRRSLLHR